MWLLDTTTLQLCAFFSTPPPYAILSHTWGVEEVTFQEMGTPDAERKRGFKKITQCCAQAKLDGLKYAWVDTCCIDKRSSAELSEAINSMFRWYSEAHICYAYLEDVDIHSRCFWETASRQSRWFKRGWTLQELLAPKHVTFFDKDWSEIGTKLSLLDDVSQITGIPHVALLHPSIIYEHSVSERMSWASNRQTTRLEDVAYCLLGIFGVNMPLLYGEGKRAFRRLQLKILSGSDDHSIFAWTKVHESGRLPEPVTKKPVSILADSPAFFGRGIVVLRQEGNLRLSTSSDRCPIAVTNLGLSMSNRCLTPIVVTNLGLSMSLPIASFPHMAISDPDMETSRIDGSFIAILNCLYQGQRVGIRVLRYNGLFQQWSRYGRDALVFLDPQHVSRIKAENVFMSIEDHERPTLDANWRVELCYKATNFLASPSDAAHVRLFRGEEVVRIEDAVTEDGDGARLEYDSHRTEYRRSISLRDSHSWLAVMVRTMDGRSLTIALGPAGDHFWSSGVTHQQPQSLVDIAIPLWKRFRESSSGSGLSHWQYFRDRATYKLNDSLQFRMTMKSIPEYPYSPGLHRLEISQELIPTTVRQADILFPK